MSYDDLFSIIFKLATEFTSQGYDKWFANIDEIDEMKSNLRILGINKNESIVIYDDILLTQDAKNILKLLSKTDINFIYITGILDLK